MNPADILRYYNRDDIKEELLKIAKNKEVVGVFKNGSYSQRPNTILYPQDIIALVRTGCIEFHCSLEHWKNPILIKDGNYNKMRIGFDIILDVDCKVFDISKIATNIFLNILERHDIKNYSLKFTGGKGFHIGIPWEAIPKEINYKPSEKLYPEISKNVIEYVKHLARDKLAKSLLKKWTPEKIAEMCNISIGELITEDGINPYKIVDIDPLLVSPRHLFRMPYSLNRNSFLVSLPISKNRLEDFEKKMALPKNVNTKEKFFKEVEDNEAELLIIEAMDWSAHRKEERPKMIKQNIKKPVSLDYAPPCIKQILNGLSDGKKRSLFILLNYLSSLKWKREDIENLINEWNKKNNPSLKESYVRGQLRYHFRKDTAIPPPNCAAEGYYKDIGVCIPDEICNNIKNPVNYVFKKLGINKSRKKRLTFKSKR